MKSSAFIHFINECIKANQELHAYLTHNVSPQDYLYQEDIGEGGDYSIFMDLKAEFIFVKYLNSFGNIYSEECGMVKTINMKNKDYTIVIDPLDGSANFVAQLPYYGTSVALEYKGNVIVSIVCNLNSKQLYIKDEEENFSILSLEGKLIHLGETNGKKIGIFERSYAHPVLCQKLFDHNIKYRSPGAIALSLCSAFSVSFVLFYGSMREFDLKAALYICSDLNVYKTPDLLLVSKNETIFNQIKEIIKEY